MIIMGKLGCVRKGRGKKKTEITSRGFSGWTSRREGPKVSRTQLKTAQNPVVADDSGCCEMSLVNWRFDSRFFFFFCQLLFFPVVLDQFKYCYFLCVRRGKFDTLKGVSKLIRLVQ